MKYCTVCKENKLDSNFYYRSDKPYLLQSHCKKCILEKRRNYRKKNIEYFKEKDRKYSKINRYKKLIYLKNWQQSNREHINTKFKEKHNNNLKLKTMTIKKYDYSKSTEDIFYKVIYPIYAREFLFGSNYEQFAFLVSANFILNAPQWEYILEHWEQKESILTIETK